MIGWNFPSNGGGQKQGISEAGIQTFTGKEILSLAREICQNSLDAVADENSPVTVEFYQHFIDPKKIPAFDTYKEILHSCRDYWPTNPKVKNFFDTAIRQLSYSKISVLQISDFNTTGLSKPFDDDAQEGWNTLTKIDGGATKTGDTAGSFGIGKNAPFTNSYLRLIFYRTLNSDDERAAQGMARLISFRLDAENIATGIGYYGDPHGNMPVKSIPELDELSIRTRRGTDVFIYGFNGQEDWADEIVRELVENFLVSIQRGKLCVKIQGFTLDKKNLGDTVERCVNQIQKSKFKKNAQYYKILSDTSGAVKTFEKDFHGMGTLKLRVLCHEDFQRKILVVRKSGMKLFDFSAHKLSISPLIKFCAILELEGHELNAFFRDMETPTHDKWDYKRHDDRSTAKEYLNELKNWLRENISSLITENVTDEVNVEGLSDMLNFDFDDSAINTAEDETLDSRKTPEETKPDVEKTPAVIEIENRNSSNNQSTKGTTTGGGLSAIRNPTGHQHKKNRANRTGNEDTDAEDTVFPPEGDGDKGTKNKSVNFNKVRVIKVGEKNYRLILRVNKTIASGHIEIFYVGENKTREQENISITSVTNLNFVDAAQASGDKIIFKNLRANTDAKISFTTADAKIYSLGVTVYAN